ncbi:unnamed protein product [Mytilus edulis]|uniref:Tyr recombinase domain-containing protein n=1 Tax=Mytilus edulis TaxID=6550 RepID=A0A8S3S4S0_MYTED|nr:unnamed protein product [Mytilus edulis]
MLTNNRICISYCLEIEKDKFLKQNNGDFDTKIIISNESVDVLNWWISHVESSFKPLVRKDPEIILKTDSSKTGWGGVVDNTQLQTKGFWSYEEQKLHINYLELKAAFLALKCFCSTKSDKHVRIYMDNMVAVTYIDKMGGRIQSLNTLTREIWQWCIHRNIWLSACHLPGKTNVEADKLSRSNNTDLEWKLNTNVFMCINSIYGPHDIDLFASRINHQLSRYISYLPDPNAEAHGRKSYPKTDFGGSRNNLNSTFVEHSTLVPSNTASYCSGFLHNTQGKRTTVVDTANRSSKETSVEKTDFGCLQIVGQIVQNTGLSKKAAEIVISSWRQSTQKQYWTYLKKWCTFCCQRKIDIFTPTEVDVVEFLTVLYESGVGYSSINTARSALSSYLTLGKTLPIGQWPLVKRFLRGVYNKRPMFPRYQQTWDVNVVLEFLITLSPVKLLSLRCLTLKLVMLLALVTGQRIQTLHCVDLDFMKITKDNVVIEINEVLKTSKPGKHLSPICLPAFVDDTRLCIVTVLNAYIERTSAIRTSQKLFVTFVKPYHHPTKSTISNWIKLVLKLAGVNTSVFKTHSTRGASTSAALRAGVSVNSILKSAGWTNESTFRQFYNRPVTVQEYNDNYSVRSTSEDGIPVWSMKPSQVLKLNMAHPKISMSLKRSADESEVIRHPANGKNGLKISISTPKPKMDNL